MISGGAEESGFCWARMAVASERANGRSTRNAKRRALRRRSNFGKKTGPIDASLRIDEQSGKKKRARGADRGYRTDGAVFKHRIEDRFLTALGMTGLLTERRSSVEKTLVTKADGGVNRPLQQAERLRNKAIST